MKLDAVDHDSLAALGAQAVGLLCRGELDTLALLYGYVFRHGREPEEAIRGDLQRALSEVEATALAPMAGDPVKAVTFYKPNKPNIVAVVECLAPTDNGAGVMVEFIVTTSGAESHLTLEEISRAW